MDSINNRVTSPYPLEPVIIFSGAHQPDKIEALHSRQVEAIMTSFDYFKSPARWAKFHHNIGPLFDAWPTRRYLDSGVFTLMRRAGVSRAKIHLDSARDKDAKRFFQSDEEIVVAFEKLANNYLTYLKEHGDFWDHVVELDVDQILGNKVTMEWRSKLHEVMGDRLMPVWHVANGFDGWKAMIEEFPYVAIGGDAGQKQDSGGIRSARTYAMYRQMVQYAHAHGTAVQGLGDTRLSTYLAVEWDSGDSTTWLTGVRHGQVGHLKLSERYSSSHTPQSSSKARSWIDWAVLHGIDPDKVIQQGNNIEKLLCWIDVLHERQAKIRNIYKEREIHIHGSGKWQLEKQQVPQPVQ